jgi:hypothetical protein
VRLLQLLSLLDHNNNHSNDHDCCCLQRLAPRRAQLLVQSFVKRDVVESRVSQ